MLFVWPYGSLARYYNYLESYLGVKTMLEEVVVLQKCLDVVLHFISVFCLTKSALKIIQTWANLVQDRYHLSGQISAPAPEC